MEMSGKGGDYENFPDEEDDWKEAETSFGGREQEDDEEDQTLFDRNKDVKPRLPYTNAEKRVEMKKMFGDRLYSDSLSELFLDNIQFKEADPVTDEGQVEIYYKGYKIGVYNNQTGKLTRYMDNINASDYLEDLQAIQKVREKSFSGQVESYTGEDQGSLINEMTEENIRKKFAREIQKREDSNQVGETMELNNLKEDYRRVERNQRVQTDIGKQVFDSQVRFTRRLVDFKKILERIPAFGFLLASVVGVITAIILFAKGQFYSASKSVAPPAKKSAASKKSSDDSYLKDLQNISSEILEEAGDNFEVLVAIATTIFVLYRKSR